jgi:hypothetical protein
MRAYRILPLAQQTAPTRCSTVVLSEGHPSPRAAAAAAARWETTEHGHVEPPERPRVAPTSGRRSPRRKTIHARAESLTSPEEATTPGREEEATQQVTTPFLCPRSRLGFRPSAAAGDESVSDMASQRREN